MNSLQDLNYYSSTTVSFTDDRASQLIYDRTAPHNTSITLNEGQWHLVPLGIDIVDIVNIDGFAVKPSYTISATLPGAVVVWNDVPGNCTVTNPSPGVYTISNILTIEDWNRVKRPVVNLPNAYFGSWSYTATISSSAGSKQWTVDLTFIDVTSLSVPTKMYFDEGTNQKIVGGSVIIDEGIQDPTWTVEVVPSVTANVVAFTSYGSGATTNFNSTTKIYSITGTKLQVNSHLNNLYLQTATTASQDMTITYTANNFLTFEADNKVQDLRLNANRYIGPPTHANEYSEDIPMPAGTFPVQLVTDSDFSGSDAYTLIITKLNAPNSTWTIGGVGGTVTQVSNVLTIAGTRDQVNNRLNNLGYAPQTDFDADIQLRYVLNVRGGTVQTKVQTIKSIAPHDEMSNLVYNSARVFVPGTSTSIFATNTPQITDLDPSNPTYSFQLVAAAGTFNNVSTYTLSGTKATINAGIASISYAHDATLTNSSFTAKLFKNSVQTFGSTIILDGPDYIFTPTTPVNQNKSVIEGSTHIVPYGIDITTMSTTATTLPRSYVIDVSSCPGATVTWVSTPTGCSITNPSTGVYAMTGFTSLAQWVTIRNGATVNLPSSFSGTFVYTASIPADGSSKTWTVTTVVSEVIPLSTPTTFSYTAGTTQTILGAPVLSDTGIGVPSNWTVTITPNNLITMTGFTSTGTGGTRTVDANLVMTISGTIAQINSHLSNLRITTTSSLDYSFYLTYFASNSSNSETGTQKQSIVSDDNSVLLAVRSDETYSLNTVTTISNGPQLADNGDGVYTMTVKPEPVGAVDYITSVAGSVYPVAAILGGTENLQLSNPSFNISGDGLTAFYSEPNYNSSAGRVIVFSKTTGVWVQEGILIPSDPVANEKFGLGGSAGAGNPTAISYNGNTIAIAMPNKGTFLYNGTGSSTVEGKIYVFSRTGTTWSQQAMLTPAKTSGPGWYISYFGSRGMALSPDGNTLVGMALSQLCVFSRSGTTWSQQQIITSDDFRYGAGISSPSNFGHPVFPHSSGNLIAFKAFTDVTYLGTWDYESIVTITRSGGVWGNYKFIDHPYQSPAILDFDLWCSHAIALSGDASTLAFIKGTTNQLLIYNYVANNWTLKDTISVAGRPCFLNTAGDELVVGTGTGLVKYKLINNTWTLYSSGDLSTNSNSLLSYGSSIRMTTDLTTAIVSQFVFQSPTITYNSTTKTITLTGTLGAVNGQIDSITINPTTDYSQDFDLIYTGTTPAAATATKNQLVVKV